MRRTKEQPISAQVKGKVSKSIPTKKKTIGDVGSMISTGSTLLDLAISGTRIAGGGIPGGIIVEIFGPSGSGKTVLLSEVAGAIKRADGDVMFHDPEGRLNDQFAKIFDLDIETIDYARTNTIPEVFSKIRSWKPRGNINGIMADSLAALSTNLEMSNDDGDKMGMRRAKEFSEELRKTARILAQSNMLLVCSNQLRVNVGATFGPKFTTPGGEAIGYYSSLRLQIKPTLKNSKIKRTETVKGKEVIRIVGITSEVTVVKSSIDKPYRTAPVTILFDYGIDDIRENLKFIKTFSDANVYTIRGQKLSPSLEKSIDMVERNDQEDELREEVIDLWTAMEERFESDRKKKKR